jgi:hypothetical protein
MLKFGKARPGILILILFSFCLFSCDEDNPVYHEYSGRLAITTHDTLKTALGLKLCDSVDINDSTVVNENPLYKVLNFDGPMYFGDSLQFDTSTGKWCWDIGPRPEYIGNFGLSVTIFDMTNVCDTCIPANPDTVYYNINVTGFEISIEVVHDQLQGQIAEVSIFLDSSLSPKTYSSSFLDGFELLIAYDASILKFMWAQAGALIDNGKFEHFSFRNGAFGNCVDSCPSGMLRIVGIRDENDGGASVNPNHITGPGELVVMNFLVSNDYNFAGEFVPVQFYWLDCGDNILVDADRLGDWFYLGMNVYDHEGMEFVDPTEVFGYSGPEDYCSNSVFLEKQTPKSTLFPAINFRNGGIDILPPVYIHDRGDINLNGVPYEIADAVIFSNYFIYGPAAFTINFERQKAATEVNGDGVALTVADFVYLVRVIIGDALPAPQVNPDAFAEFTRRGGTIRVKTNAEIGAVFLIFDAPVTPSLAADAGHMEMHYKQMAGTTRVLIYSLEKNHAITTGDLLDIDGVGRLVSIEAAEYRGVTLKVK